MGYSTIILEKESGVATIKLNRPKVLNAINETMGEELLSAISAIRDDREIRAILLTGEGRSFCTGGDIKEFSSENTRHSAPERRQWIRNHHRWYSMLCNLDKPVIAAVKGYAAGGGVSLALAADIIIAAESAKFVMSFVKNGVVPDMAAGYILPRLVGLNKAKEMVFTGKEYDALSAEQMGIVNLVVRDEELETKALQMAQQLAKGPTYAIGLAKAMLNKSFESDLQAFLEMEACFQAQAFASDDYKVGVRAFKEKKTPQFTGK